MITIYKFGTIQIRAVINNDDTSKQQVALMREDVLIINFAVTNRIDFRIGDYCHFMGKLYQINKLPKRTRNEKREIFYPLIMEGEMYDLRKTELLFYNSDNVLTNESIFSFRGRLQDYGLLLILNLKRLFPTASWTLGNVEDSDYKDCKFSAQNCLQAIQTIAELFGTEYLFEGKVINLYRKQEASGLILKHGEALTQLTEEDQDTSNVITRLYAFGSSRNLTGAYRGGAQMLRMGTVPYIEKNTAIYNIIEDTVIFDGTEGKEEIYPHRTGTITSVDDPLNFYDTSIDFNVNLIPGTSAKIVFNTGLLSGYTFELSAFNNATKKFTIIKNTDETTFDIPSVTMSPAVGDTYVLVDIEMPQSYIDNAEAQLRLAAQDWLDKHSIPALLYTVSCEPNWFKKQNTSFSIGQTASIIDDELLINTTTRITGYTRSINDVYLYTMELSDTVTPKPTIIKLINNI